MSGGRGVLIAVLVLYVAAAAQQAFSRWTIIGGSVDYLLLALGGLCLFTHRSGGALIGFFDGWLYASLTGVHMWQVVLTRALAGYLISWVVETGIERNLLSSLLAGLFAVLFCRIGLLFLAPPPQIVPVLGDTIRTAVYNGVLAMLLYAVLNRIIGPRR